MRAAGFFTPPRKSSASCPLSHVPLSHCPTVPPSTDCFSPSSPTRELLPGPTPFFVASTSLFPFSWTLLQVPPSRFPSVLILFRRPSTNPSTRPNRALPLFSTFHCNLFVIFFLPPSLPPPFPLPASPATSSPFFEPFFCLRFLPPAVPAWTVYYIFPHLPFPGSARHPAVSFPDTLCASPLCSAEPNYPRPGRIPRPTTLPPLGVLASRPARRPSNLKLPPRPLDPIFPHPRTRDE